MEASDAEGTVGYDYDDRGRLKEIAYPSGRKAAYTFDERGSLDTIKWEGQQSEDRSYNAVGLLTNVDRPHIDETRTYDDLNRVTTIANNNVGNASYSYDANGNKLAESWTGAMSGWNFTTQAGADDGYDDEDRFTDFIQSGQSTTIGLTRSSIGNISNVNLNGSSSARGYSNVHELTSIGGQTQTFDTDGNLTTAQSGVDLSWDGAGMMSKSIVAAGDSAGIEGTNEYGYDASQNRVNKKITRNGSVTEDTVYIYAGPNCIAEYAKGANATSPAQEYVYAQAIDSLVMIVRNGGNQKLTVTRNQQWSVSALADSASGTILERYAYDVFGKRTILASNGSTVRASSNYNNPYGYTSRRHDDESGLMYFRARYYDPQIGEFISRDPLEYVDGMSLYRAYFVPNHLDPHGDFCIATGPVFYQPCGRFQWMGFFYLDKDEEKKRGGFIVQKITVAVKARSCPDEPKKFWGSAKCGTWFTTNEDEYAVMTYWELFDMRRARAPRYQSTPDNFQLNPQLTPSWGDYIQQGWAWFHAGKVPPDGWDKWKDGSKETGNPSGDYYYRCDAPTGDAGSINNATTYREIVGSWDCCSSDKPEDQIVCGSDKPPTRVPGQNPPVIKLDKEWHTTVKGGCGG